MPMVPPPPPRLSITTLSPRLVPSALPSTRAMPSTAPPAANATISRIGRSGKAARAARGKSVAAPASAAVLISARRENDMMSPAIRELLNLQPGIFRQPAPDRNFLREELVEG